MKIIKQKVKTTNAVCCLLAMQHQTGSQIDAALLECLKQRQDTTGHPVLRVPGWDLVWDPALTRYPQGLDPE